MVNDINFFVCKLLEKEIDGIMNQRQFSRRKNSLNYIRKVENNRQRIEMVCYKNPRYYRGALAHIYPYYDIFFPELDKIVRQIAGKNDLISSLKKVPFRNPIQQGIVPDMWVIMPEQSTDMVMRDICDFLNKHTLPFLDDMRDVDSLINMYERKKKNLNLDNCKYLLIISAYIYKCQYEQALAVLEMRFGKPGVRKYYGDAFEFINSHL